MVLGIGFLAVFPAGAQQDTQPRGAARRAEVPGHRFPDDEVHVVPRSKVKVYESTFNELAAKVEPLRLDGHYTFRVCAPVVGCLDICSSDWHARVDQVSFGITPADVRIGGRVRASWCGASFEASLATSANVTYSSAQDAILVSVNPTDIQPRFQIPGYTVPLPVHINVAPSLSLPPIPVTTASFSFETARGPESLFLTPSSIVLAKRDGYLELQAYVELR